MITRRHEDGETRSAALYSDCGAYRYLLRRDWGKGGRLLFVLLNPSTATEERNDPTVERCERRARAMGFGGFTVANIFGYRATDPRELKRAAAPVGPHNDAALLAAASEAALVLCGWGVHGTHLGRGLEVAAALRAADVPLWHLGLTRGGHPRHPLYVGYARHPEPWREAPAENAEN
ncbi:DUF1643 domain-containing protein [Defluviimonas sp. WL0024]|uniref:DUF1643 domain-containing protein n=1 Tax=Albidovulum salinarum TaxID=2984153 RepID=A0ABT2X1T2_9RHOB|nr:DUF1643 domain-containing protein [Defluviimonas sp. WL0024]MCU9847908.1 DUF1643 domain-containing protein [Defluviimonas sp. WL0024]